jgi:hypothetical protein
MNSAHLNPFTELPTLGHTSLLQRRDGTLLRPDHPSTRKFSAFGTTRWRGWCRKAVFDASLWVDPLGSLHPHTQPATNRREYTSPASHLSPTRPVLLRHHATLHPAQYEHDIHSSVHRMYFHPVPSEAPRTPPVSSALPTDPNA